MILRRLAPMLLLLSVPAMAQTPAVPGRPAQPAPPAQAAQPAAQAAQPVMTPAPMPDPLMSPDLRSLPPGPPSLAKLVQQSAWQDAVIAAARNQYKLLPDACAAAVFKPTGQLTLFAPTQFNDENQLVSGIWTERVNVTGCGPMRLLNVLTVMQPGSPPSRIPTMPGDSHADPATQKNALQYAQAVAARAAPPWMQGRRMFTNARSSKAYTGLPNTEMKRWPCRTAPGGKCGRSPACGTAVLRCELTFTPNARGMQLSGDQSRQAAIDAGPSVVTFGCRLNLVESEVIRGLAAGNGRHGGRPHLRRHRGGGAAGPPGDPPGGPSSGPGRRSSSTGCARPRSTPARWAALPGVTRVLGNADKLQGGILGAGERLARSARADAALLAPLPSLGERVRRAYPRLRAGAGRVRPSHCTFCTIPAGRGANRSVAPERGWLAQVATLVA